MSAWYRFDYRYSTWCEPMCIESCLFYIRRAKFWGCWNRSVYIIPFSGWTCWTNSPFNKCSKLLLCHIRFLSLPGVMFMCYIASLLSRLLARHATFPPPPKECLRRRLLRCLFSLSKHTQTNPVSIILFSALSWNKKGFCLKLISNLSIYRTVPRNALMGCMLSSYQAVLSQL